MGPKPAAVVGRVTASWSKRLQAAHVEGASTVRLLLEWGVTLRGGGKHAVFLRAAQAGGARGSCQERERRGARTLRQRTRAPLDRTSIECVHHVSRRASAARSSRGASEARGRLAL